MADHTLLLKNADLLCTMAAHPEKGPPAKTAGQANDHCGDEIKNGGLFARNGVIEAVGEKYWIDYFKKIKEVLNTMSLYLGMEIPNWPPDNIAELSCLLYTSPSPRDATLSRMPSSA